MAISVRFLKTLDFNKWKHSVLNNSVYETLHNYILDSKKDIKEIYIYLNNTSIQFNVDKTTIIKKYFDYIIRNRKNIVNKESPDWLKDKLYALGLKPISAVVGV